MEQLRQRSGKRTNFDPLALLAALASASASGSSLRPALGRTRHARTMIQELGQFLRFSLSFGP